MNFVDHNLALERRTVQALLHGDSELGVDRLCRDAAPALRTGVIDHEGLLEIRLAEISSNFRSPSGLPPAAGSSDQYTQKQFCTTVRATEGRRNPGSTNGFRRPSPGLGGDSSASQGSAAWLRPSAAPWATIHRPTWTEILTYGQFLSFVTETRLECRSTRRS